MAYPFTKMPTLGEFIDAVTSNFEVKIEKPKTDPSEECGQIELECLVRTGKEGKIKIAIIPDMTEDESLTPDLLRSLCKQLDIPAEELGLSLG